MTTDVALFNWADETLKVEEFFAGPHGILHVLGNESAYINHFDQVITKVVRSSFGDRASVSLIDPFNQVTSSPLGAVRAIVQDLGLPEPPPPGRVISTLAASNIGSNVTAGRDAKVEVTYNAPSHNEGEELNSLVKFVLAHIERGVELQGKVVVFRQCHEMKLRHRKIFWVNVWAPLLAELANKGLKVVFLFCPATLNAEDEAIPPASRVAVNLPKAFSNDHVENEIASHLAREGFARAGEAALAAARVVLLTSSTVRETYEKLALLALSPGYEA